MGVILLTNLADASLEVNMIDYADTFSHNNTLSLDKGKVMRSYHKSLLLFQTKKRTRNPGKSNIFF